MGWQDRDYNTSGGGDFLANPGAILSLSVPVGTWLGVRVRLHFWLLLSFVFALAELARGVTIFAVAVGIVSLFAAVLLHEFGHRWATMLVGGRHDDFMLWPAGGLSFPSAPPGDGPRFFVFAGGMAVNLIAAVVCWTALWFAFHVPPLVVLNPLAALSMSVPMYSSERLSVAVLGTLALANGVVMLVNVLPYYIFDGAFMLQSMLGPFTGGYQAINVTCFVGMVLAVPMFFLGLVDRDFLGMIFWVLLFSMSYGKRRELQASGTHEFDDAIAYSAQMGSEPALKRRWSKRTGVSTTQLMRQAEADRKEQRKIDAILAKVSAQGMHTLTWRERRVLKVATERQRNRSTR